MKQVFIGFLLCSCGCVAKRDVSQSNTEDKHSSIAKNGLNITPVTMPISPHVPDKGAFFKEKDVIHVKEDKEGKETDKAMEVKGFVMPPHPDPPKNYDDIDAEEGESLLEKGHEDEEEEDEEDDEGDNGVLDDSEIKKMLESVGAPNFDWHAYVHAAYDHNKDGSLAPAEFYAMRSDADEKDTYHHNNEFYAMGRNAGVEQQYAMGSEADYRDVESSLGQQNASVQLHTSVKQSKLDGVFQVNGNCDLNAAGQAQDKLFWDGIVQHLQKLQNEADKVEKCKSEIARLEQEKKDAMKSAPNGRARQAISDRKSKEIKEMKKELSDAKALKKQLDADGKKILKKGLFQKTPTLQDQIALRYWSCMVPCECETRRKYWSEGKAYEEEWGAYKEFEKPKSPGQVHKNPDSVVWAIPFGQTAESGSSGCKVVDPMSLKQMDDGKWQEVYNLRPFWMNGDGTPNLDVLWRDVQIMGLPADFRDSDEDLDYGTLTAWKLDGGLIMQWFRAYDDPFMQEYEGMDFFDWGLHGLKKYCQDLAKALNTKRYDDYAKWSCLAVTTNGYMYMSKEPAPLEMTSMEDLKAFQDSFRLHKPEWKKGDINVETWVLTKPRDTDCSTRKAAEDFCDFTVDEVQKNVRVSHGKGIYHEHIKAHPAQLKCSSIKLQPK